MFLAASNKYSMLASVNRVVLVYDEYIMVQIHTNSTPISD